MADFLAARPSRSYSHISFFLPNKNWREVSATPR